MIFLLSLNLFKKLLPIGLMFLGYFMINLSSNLILVLYYYPINLLILCLYLRLKMFIEYFNSSNKFIYDFLFFFVFTCSFLLKYEDDNEVSIILFLEILVLYFLSYVLQLSLVYLKL